MGVDNRIDGTAEPARRLASLLEHGRRGLRSVMDVLYPPQCAGCGRAIAEAQALCGVCWGTLPLIARPYCERLGAPFAFDHGPHAGTGLLSPAAMADPPVFDRARAVALYDGRARALVHRLKFGDRHDVVPLMVRLMVHAGAELLADADVLVPVPLHWTRGWSRRFNQSALLAHGIARASRLPVEDDALVRVRRTRSQVGLSRSERQRNVDGALRVQADRRPLVSGRRVLVIDDVMTTAATANASSRALLRAGAKAVDVLTFARVAP